MLIPHGVAAGLQDLPGTKLAQRYSLYDAIGGRMGEINRLISPSHAGGVSAIGARVEQVAGQQATQYTPPDPRTHREPQLVYGPIEGRVLHDDGVMRVATVVGFGWYYV